MRAARGAVLALGLTLAVAMAGCDSGSGGGATGTATAPEQTASVAPSSPPSSPASSPARGTTLLALGDIGDCRANGDRGQATAALASRLSGPIALLGDIAYSAGSTTDYARCFWPAWQPLRGRVRAVIGNHDDRNRSTFFATWPDAGTSTQPWYAFDVGTWQVLVVDANCSEVSCAADAPQTQWLVRRLAADRSRCTILAMHQPRFSSDDEHGDDPLVDTLWRTAYRGGVDLVLAGHAHDYERVGPLGIDGRLAAGGPVQFVVGTGGAGRYGWADITAASKVRVNDTWGLLQLTLANGSWKARFRAAPSGQVRDTSTGTCR